MRHINTTDEGESDDCGEDPPDDPMQPVMDFAKIDLGNLSRGESVFLLDTTP
jgi:hypothetical protein